MKKLLLLFCAMLFTIASHAAGYYVVCIGGQTYGFGELSNGYTWVDGPSGSCPYFQPTVMNRIIALPSSPSGTGSEFDVNMENMLNNFDFEQRHTPTDEEQAQFEAALADAGDMPVTYVYYYRLNSNVQALFDSIK